jgi:NodT family efflux transporter outer membrane factor (OMF) lipoprotein
MKTPISLLVLLLAGCAVGPDYLRPDVTTPAAYKEAGDWKPAEPKDLSPRGSWWEIYGDAELNMLVAQVAISNQNVLAAAAQYRQTQAALGLAQAAYFPTLAAGLADSRGTSATTTGVTTEAAPIRNTARVSLNASWEADVWGQVRRNVEASDATAQASDADLRAALLSAQATLVQTYVQLRATEAQQRLLEQTTVAYERSLQITSNRYEAGVAGRVDVAQAETQLKSTQAQLIDLGVQRAQLEHAIAVLIGSAPADFQLKPVAELPSLPTVPVAMPSALLERRPDIAAAERRMAAANALIGVAQAAFFPALNFSATGGYQNSGFSHLLSLPNRFWSIGPALALTLFDAGARSAQKESAIAGYDKSVASYRQTVLTAFQEVEDNLAALRQLKAEAEMQRLATQSAAEALTLTENQYQAGTVSYLNVVTAQATALGAQRSSLDITSRQLLANVALIKALGGLWQ